ncbi:MAG: hypothetical protein ACC707_05100 [Thiohalomonadales bacterium]
MFTHIYITYRRKLSVLIFLLVFSAIPSTPLYAVEFSLFGDVNIIGSDNEGESTSFVLGQIDLIANQEISPTTSVVVELVLESGIDANTATNTTNIDVERFAITKKLSENTEIGLGRFHTPIGIWNTSFHHGSLIQDTVSRPFFLDFEDSGGVMPVHMVGVSLNGNKNFFNYQMMVGNNNGMNTSKDPTRVTSSELIVFNNIDLSNNKSYAIRTGFEFLKHSAEFGLNYLNGDILETGDPSKPPAPLTAQGELLFNQEIIGMDLHWEFGDFYILTEIYQINTTENPDLPASGVIGATGLYSADAAYFQFSYLPTDRLTLSLRYETLTFEIDNRYMTTLGKFPEERNVAVLSYQMEESNALRLEFNQSTLDNPTNDSSLSFTVQWYFLLI